MNEILRPTAFRRLARTPLAALLAFLWAGATPPPAVAAPYGDEAAHTEILRLDASQVREFGLEIAKAGPATIHDAIASPGEIHPNDDRLAHIVPRYAGIVTDVRAAIGDRVEAGEVLAAMPPPEPDPEPASEEEHR